MYISAIKKTGLLRQICEGAKAAGATLKEALLAYQKSIFSESFQRGRILVSTSGNGQQGSFEVSHGGKEFTQDNVFAVSEEFLQIHDFIVAQELATAPVTPAEIDAFFALMQADDRLATIKSAGSDYTMLGWQNQTGGVPS